LDSFDRRPPCTIECESRRNWARDGRRRILNSNPGHEDIEKNRGAKVYPAPPPNGAPGWGWDLFTKLNDYM